MPTVNFYCVLCGSALQISSESPREFLKCHCCARYVPVPKPVPGRDELTCVPRTPELPEEVLELLVKFQCMACGSELYADARSEGRDVVCSHCREHTGVPHWSRGLGLRRFSEAGKISRMRTDRSSARATPPVLSFDEIEFLRGAESGNPGAAA